MIINHINIFYTFYQQNISWPSLQGSRREWQRVFFICSGLYAIGFIIFMCWASGEEQEWAKVSSQCIVCNQHYITMANIHKNNNLCDISILH